MKHIYTALFSLLLMFSFLERNTAQNKYAIATIGFYNVENLFDTIDTKMVRDTEFSPEGSKLWNAEKYHKKLNNLATVIDKLGKNKNKDGVTLLGLSEVENRSVLEDLTNHSLIKDKKYRIVHFDSPDRRGIDVAMIYQAKRFQVTDAKPLPIDIYDGTEKIFTREILYVEGLLDGDKIYILVNHWPSRSGGESRTAPWRSAGAQVNKNIVDSLYNIDPHSKVIIMGDLNDDPNSPSVKDVLKTKNRKKEVKQGGLFNPMHQYFRRGIGSNAYRDNWSLFDQIIFTEAFLNDESQGYEFLKAYVYNKKFLRQKRGHFKGYPYRTFSGDEFIGGYSDHFPVYIHLIKKH